jgi:SAM-dependent methyltransferase
LPEADGLEFTGERVVPGLVDPNLFNEHLARYRFAALFARGARVLDAGCGSGYGAVELKDAASVYAMDISAEAVGHARRAFAAPSNLFIQGKCEQVPFANASFDLVVAFEVIEHLARWQDFLSEARRVLTPSGTLLLSTPNKAWYAESRAKAGPNPYHVHEFEHHEFEAALKAEFPHVHLWTQNHSEAIVFVPATVVPGKFDAPADTAPEQAHFFLAACSQSPVPYRGPFGWLPTSGNVLRERQKHIQLLEREVAQKNRWLADAAKSQAALQCECDKLEAELKERNEWAAQLDREMEKARGVIGDLREELSTTRAGYEEQINQFERDSATRLQWIADLENQITRGDTEIERQRAELKDHLNTIAARTEWAHSLDQEMQNERVVYRQLEQQHLEALEHLRTTQAELEGLKAELAFTDSAKWVRLGRSLSLMQAKAGDANG